MKQQKSIETCGAVLHIIDTIRGILERRKLLIFFLRSEMNARMDGIKNH